MKDSPLVPPGQFSDQFVQEMKYRMAMGFLRYGHARDNFPSRVDALETMRLRVREYEKTGNTENLVDAANYLMCEFMYPAHPRAHFQPTDGNASPGIFSRDDGVVKDRHSSEMTTETWDEIQKIQKEKPHANRKAKY